MQDFSSTTTDHRDRFAPLFRLYLLNFSPLDSLVPQDPIALFQGFVRHYEDSGKREESSNRSNPYQSASCKLERLLQTGPEIAGTNECEPGKNVHPRAYEPPPRREPDVTVRGELGRTLVCFEEPCTNERERNPKQDVGSPVRDLQDHQNMIDRRALVVQ